MDGVAMVSGIGVWSWVGAVIGVASVVKASCGGVAVGSESDAGIGSGVGSAFTSVALGFGVGSEVGMASAFTRVASGFGLGSGVSFGSGARFGVGFGSAIGTAICPPLAKSCSNG